MLPPMPHDSIAKDLVVSLHYTLTCEGEVVDDTRAENEPLAYLHGHDNMPPGLEAALAGAKVGDQLETTLEPEQGFGPHNPGGVLQLPTAEFPAGEKLAVGMQLGLENEDGEMHPAYITDIGEEVITVDLNHPMAGRTVTYAVEVVGIRAATAEELEHGHPHDEGDCGH